MYNTQVETHQNYETTAGGSRKSNAPATHQILNNYKKTCKVSTCERRYNWSGNSAERNQHEGDDDDDKQVFYI